MRQVLYALEPGRIMKIADIEATTVSGWAWWLVQQHEDLRQEALIKICEAASIRMGEFSKRSAGEQYSYLRHAARSACISYLRKQKRHYKNRDNMDPEFFLGLEDHGGSPDDACQASERVFELHDLFVEAMALMSRRERESFLWKLGVGPELNVSKWTARTYSDRARAKLSGLAKRRKAEWLTAGRISRLFQL